MCGLYFFCGIRRTTTDNFVAWVVNILMHRLKQQIVRKERLTGERDIEGRRHFNVQLNMIRGGGGTKRSRGDEAGGGEAGEGDSKRQKVEHSFRTLDGHSS